MKALEISKATLPPRSLEDFKRRYVHISQGSKVADLHVPPQCGIYRWDDFVKHSASAVVEEITGSGGIKRTPLAQIWLASDDRITVHDTVYHPGTTDNFVAVDGAVYYNVFCFPPHSDADDTLPALFLDHLEYLFGDQCETMLNYLAHVIQKPQERPSFVPYNIATSHGTGRGWLDQLMIRVIGPWNCSATKIGTLIEAASGGFSNFYNDTLWVSVGEAREDGGQKFAVDDKLRDLLTDKYLMLNPKYGKQMFKAVYSRTFLCSNHIHDGLIVPEGDRRIFATLVHDSPKAEREYNMLYAELSNPSFISRCFYGLKHRDISKFNALGRAPHTEIKQRLIASSRSETEEALLDLPGRIGEKLQDTWMPEIMTYEQICTFCGIRGEQAAKAMRAVLKSKAQAYYAGRGSDGRMKWRGKPVRVWITKNPKKWHKASIKDVRAELDRIQNMWDKSHAPFDDDPPMDALLNTGPILTPEDLF